MPYDYKAKAKNIKQLNQYMLAKTLSMFEYENLPPTIPAREFERLIQTHGYAFVTKVGADLYAFYGGKGGVTDAYGQPTEIVISNPFLSFNKTLNIENDGVLVRCDDMEIGLVPLFEKNNTFLAENDINMMVWGYNSRAQKLISAPDDKTRESAELYMKKIIDGDLSVIGENALFDGVKMQAPASGASTPVTQMTEFQQYIKSVMFNEIGLSSNFNMKRERLISSEVDQAEDSLFPYVYNMMENRLAAVKAINEMYGTDIKVDFGSVWALKNKKLVDGVVGNNEPVADSVPDAANPEQSPEQAAKSEPVAGLEQEKADVNTQPENGNDNGESAQSPDPETVAEPDADNADGNNPDADNADGNNPEIVTEENNDEQEQRQSDSANDSGDSGNVSESEKQIADLEAVINDPESSPDDIKAAQDLLDELKAKGE